MFQDNFTWSWVEMCGPGGLVVWSPSKHDIGACFQQIFLQIPVLCIFAIVSAYFYGARSSTPNTQIHRKWVLRARIIFSSLIALTPMCRTVVGLTGANNMFRDVDYFTSAVEIVAWIVHTGYVHSLTNRRNVHGPVLVRVLWTLTAVLSILNLRSLVITQRDLPNPTLLGFAIAVVVLQVLYGLTFFTFCYRKREERADGHTQFTERSSLLGSYYHGFREDLDSEYLGVGLNWDNVPSWLFFYWVNPLIKKGVDNKIRSCDDIYDLPNGWDSSNLCMSLQSVLQRPEGPEAVAKPPISLLSALHKCFGITFYSLGLLKFFADLASFAGPILLNQLVTFIEVNGDDHSKGYILAFLLFLSTFLGSLCNVMFTFLVSMVGLRMRGALISVVYRKALHLSYWAVNSFTVGEIVNFMSTDTDRIVNSCPSFHTFWSIPLQIVISFYLLYQQVGISFLAGVVFTIVLIPVNKCIANKIGSLSTKMMSAKDERVSTMSEVLRGIRVLKLHVWEEHFLDKILGVRKRELKFLAHRKYLDALCVYFWASTPVLVSVLTLATYSLLGNPLDAATVFTTVALLNMLIGPLNAFPWVLNGLVEAWVSLKRLQRLMDVPNMELRDYYNPGDETIALEECFTDWNATEGGQRGGFSAPGGLQNASLKIESGQLVGVIGNVGSGKSAFLMSLLGEMYKTSGSVSVINWEGGFGLVAQTPWLQHASLRDNVLFGKSFIASRYKAVLDACALSEDIGAMHGGDMAQVGEGGTTLSGGQRARLALARAVYQDKDVYLIDDVLSALDPPVARHVYSKVICGLLKQKTRIFCTNHVQFLTNADLVVQMEDGRIVRAGKPSDVLPNFDALACCDTESMASYKESRDETEPVHPEDEETSEIGAVKAAIYRRYAAAVGPALTFSILASLLLMQASRNASDYWLSIWVSAGNVTESPSRTRFYLTVYTVLAISNTFFTLFRAFLFAYGGVRAAKVIHQKLLKKVMLAKVTYFDISPLGRILNRFSSDTYTVDDSLPFITNILMAQVFGLAGSLCITIYGMPWLCLLIAPLIPMYHSLQRSYRYCSRDLKRLASVTLSPLYSHISETLQGLVTIRAFRSLSHFQQRNEEYLDNYQRALYSSNSVTGWLSVRLQMMGVAMVTGVALVAVLQHQFDIVAPALVGLTVAYALSINSLLSGVISAFAETEREFVALERVSQYIDEFEAEQETGNHPPYAWPSQGVVCFHAVYLKYRDHLAPSLNGISFETRPAEKIGVVGRTGAGKSSLIAALLRLVKISSGSIIIDNVNINQLLLSGLRSRIAVIPQDPYLFKGTIRENLDPLSEYTDVEIWRAVEKCHCRRLIEDVGGFTHAVEPAGRNFSLGQRQLLCLARAVLKNVKIVCIDEATASVDQETDRLIQLAIRSCFRQSTVLTIAHRMSTVMDSDRLLVLRDGEVIEFDTPDNLVSDTTSYFYKLSQRSK